VGSVPTGIRKLWSTIPRHFGADTRSRGVQRTGANCLSCNLDQSYAVICAASRAHLHGRMWRSGKIHRCTDSIPTADGKLTARCTARGTTNR